ncbi:TPR repeat-containing thioredoxin TTL1 [Linum grandiflorum]
MSQSGKPIDDHSHLRMVESVSDQLRDSLSSLEANKPDFRELDLGSPVSPLRARVTATTTTTTSSSSSSSGSVSGTRNGQNPVAKLHHSGEICTSSSDTSPTTSAGLKTPSKPTSQARSDPLIYSGSGGHSSVNSPPTNVLPTGNICPSGTGNYGHGSIMRGGGGGGVSKSTGVDNASNWTSSSNSCGSVLRGNASVGRGSGGIVDPEEVKRAANDMYKKGHFSEALALYEKAIALSPANAAYRSNRAAALMSLGRVAEAVRECEEAVRLDPNYSRAHQRLGSLLIRLGQVESARKHLCLPGQPQDPSELSKLQLVEKHINRCAEARKSSDWKSVLRECDAAIVAGADCSPLSNLQLFICKAEAHFKLHNLDDAESCLLNGPRMEYYSSSCLKSKIFGMLCEAYSFLIKAQIEMALGRFDSAVTAAERAAQIDPRNIEVAILLKNVRLVSRSRARGNDLFKSERFTEACAAYGEGLKVDPSNAVLYCNRAACWYKLGMWERSIEDCNQALRIQPNYMKALLRRAASNSKLDRWGDAVRDYEVLRRELPNDSEVAESLFHAQVALKKSRGEEVYNMKFGGEVEQVSGIEQFRAAISVPGVSIVHFLSPSNLQCKQMCAFVDALCSRYPSINFFKVDIEDNSDVATTENVRIVPTFKIYKDGTRVKEIICPTRDILEHSVRHYSF